MAMTRPIRETSQTQYNAAPENSKKVKRLAGDREGEAMAVRLMREEGRKWTDVEEEEEAEEDKLFMTDWMRATIPRWQLFLTTLKNCLLRQGVD